ncbi:helix-turn-helix domain-containing protein [Acidimicrobiia bacterium EGI L10123]|uniref:helix-turn-helix domain-containing protein n=1 Tax=Salinilacustrithrix flava TaxID=2957203 RepID=UPI003D7C290F|nr:helix-turn-helix domain-containing protein [Acidimicrobiia bacterium EGI L10123]
MKLRRRKSGATTTRQYSLRELREELGCSQAELARRLGTSQPAVLKTENAADPRLSTVRRYVAALAELNDEPWHVGLAVAIGDHEVELVLPGANRNAPNTQPVSTTVPKVGVLPEALATENPVGTWRLRAWDDPELEMAWLDRLIISMSADEIGDVTHWPGAEALARNLSEALPGRTPQAIGMFVTYWRYFRREMSIGDLVLVPLSARRVAIARIAGDYEYRSDEPEPKLRHVRPVEWLRVCSRSELDEDLRRVVNAPGTICRVSAAGAAQRLL